MKYVLLLCAMLTFHIICAQQNSLNSTNEESKVHQTSGRHYLYFSTGLSAINTHPYKANTLPVQIAYSYSFRNRLSLSLAIMQSYRAFKDEWNISEIPNSLYISYAHPYPLKNYDRTWEDQLSWGKVHLPDRLNKLYQLLLNASVSYNINKGKHHFGISGGITMLYQDEIMQAIIFDPVDLSIPFLTAAPNEVVLILPLYRRALAMGQSLNISYIYQLHSQFQIKIESGIQRSSLSTSYYSLLSLGMRLD